MTSATRNKIKLAAWELGCVVWICIAGALLHFAFELTEFWKPMALIAAVNESAWEHTKMYFWPGLLYALIQYTYTRDIANNYWLGKAIALAATPLLIFVCYYSYMDWALSNGGKPSLSIMLSIMVLAVSVAQFISYKVLTAEPFAPVMRTFAAAGYAVLIFMFSTFTYFPPKVFLFENYFCYQYTGDFGILPDYEPYRVFTRTDEAGQTSQGGGVNYCENIAQDGETDPSSDRVARINT